LCFGGGNTKRITREMIKIYKPLGRDWLNYKVTQSNPLTFHHIEKKCDGGKEELSNGALITVLGHQYLHLIECRDKETYLLLNKMFKMINTQGTAPTPEQREIIEYLLKEFEVLHKNDKNSKGKTLIQYKYLKRE
jgi:hypothetical protein